MKDFISLLDGLLDLLTLFISLASKLLGIAVFIGIILNINWARELVLTPATFLHVLWAIGFFYQPFPKNSCGRG